MVADTGIPAGYKQTEVGLIPEDWEVKKLEDMVSIRKQKHDPRKEGNNDFCIELEHIGQGNGCLLGNTETTINSSIKAVFKKNDVLFGRLRAYLRKYWMANRDGVASTEIWPLIVNSDLSIPEYIFQIVQTSRFINSASEAYGTHMPRTDWNVMKNVLIATPPSIEEQTAIATILSDTDALIDHLEKLIAKKKNIKQGAMQQLLTGKKRLSGFGGEWSTISMAKHASLKARIGWQALTTKEYLDIGTYYLVTGTDFISGRVNWSTCHFVDEWRYRQDRNIQLRDGDVLLTKDGTIGKVGYVENLHGSASLNSGVFVIRPLGEVFVPLFLFYVLTSKIFDDFILKITAGSTITHLYQKDFVSFEFLAPEINEQSAIATILSDMDVEIEALEQKRDKYTMIKQGMMQELLTGKTRLV